MTKTETLALAQGVDTGALMHHAAPLRDQGHGNLITYSRKVFIPLTHLCRDSCHYCTFARAPRKGEQLYMSLLKSLSGLGIGLAIATDDF